jgi:Na+/H+ antiporter NhaD/arsenite permease-like protein
VLAPTLVFAVAYLVIAGLRLPGLVLDRPAAALVGAAAMVVVSPMTARDALGAVNLDTLGLLLGMMILSALLMEAGFFKRIAWLTVTHATSARAMLVGLVAVSGGLSAVLVNDVVCVMFTPIVVGVVRAAGLPALPFLLALASASNVGGVATLTGNPQNMIIGTTSGLDYARYALRMTPVAAVGLAIDAALLLWIFRDELPRGPLAPTTTEEPPLDGPLARTTVAGLLIAVVGFAIGRSMAGSALFGAAFALLFARRPPRLAFEKVDWSLLVFFGGLFVLVDGAARTGAIEAAHRAVAPLFGAGAERQLVAFGVFTELASNVFSNVPFVLVARAWVPALASPEWQWTGLAMTSTLAGNLTIVGSVANLIVFELAGPDGRVGFLRFAKVGVVVTLATTAVGMAMLVAEMRLGW